MIKRVPQFAAFLSAVLASIAVEALPPVTSRPADLPTPHADIQEKLDAVCSALSRADVMRAAGDLFTLTGDARPDPANGPWYEKYQVVNQMVYYLVERRDRKTATTRLPWVLQQLQIGPATLLDS